jgi:hypothetical protein
MRSIDLARLCLAWTFPTHAEVLLLRVCELHHPLLGEELLRVLQIYNLSNHTMSGLPNQTDRHHYTSGFEAIVTIFHNPQSRVVLKLGCPHAY